ncbi:glycosyltransferase-like domain-containing protein 1 [Arapaima gigas]
MFCGAQNRRRHRRTLQPGEREPPQHKPSDRPASHPGEHDKDPEVFFKTFLKLKEKGQSFQVPVLGETFSYVPGVFVRSQERRRRLPPPLASPRKEELLETLRLGRCRCSYVLRWARKGQRGCGYIGDRRAERPTCRGSTGLFDAGLEAEGTAGSRVPGSRSVASRESPAPRAEYRMVENYAP